MEIKVVRLRPEAVLPTRAHAGDAGYDLRSAMDAVIQPGRRLLVPTGIAVEIPGGYAGFVQPRSGLAVKHGISLVNTPGLIDSSYRGEIQVIMINLDDKEAFRVKKGDRIAQLVIQAVADYKFIEAAELSKSERGADGFGSSGNR